MSDDTKEWLAGEALRLGNEVRDLSISNAVLRDDNSKLKDENEELHKDYESLADEHTKLIDRNKTLKDELRKRALDSLSDIGQLGEQSAEIARLKAEVERLTERLNRHLEINDELDARCTRLRKAGDAVALDYAERIEIEAGETVKTLMKTLPVLREWNAAKEGKPSV